MWWPPTGTQNQEQLILDLRVSDIISCSFHLLLLTHISELEKGWRFPVLVPFLSRNTYTHTNTPHIHTHQNKTIFCLLKEQGDLKSRDMCSNINSPRVRHFVGFVHLFAVFQEPKTLPAYRKCSMCICWKKQLKSIWLSHVRSVPISTTAMPWYTDNRNLTVISIF